MTKARRGTIRNPFSIGERVRGKGVWAGFEGEVDNHRETVTGSVYQMEYSVILDDVKAHGNVLHLATSWVYGRHLESIERG